MKPLKNVSLTKLYICDRKQCGADCHYPTCYHTTNPEHALYPTHDWDFAEVSINASETVYHVDLWEVAKYLPDYNYIGVMLANGLPN